MKIKLTIPGICAVLFWVVSVILAVKISPNSHSIWLPDTLLLLGFWPLLIGCRARWLWLTFGILNMIVGCALALSAAIPDAGFTPYHMVEMKKHIELYHPFLVWLLIGFLSAVIGGVLLLTALISSVVEKFKKRRL